VAIFLPQCVSKGFFAMMKLSLSLRAILVLSLCGGLQLAAAQALKPASAGKAAARRTEVPTAVPVQRETAPLEALSAEQMELANRVALGKMPCELGAHVSLRPDARGAGRFVLELGKQQFFMVPVSTRTGAIRLEDEVAGVVWLQLANKSMLMSQRQGKRLADACVSAEQLIVAKDLERNPAPNLLDGPANLQPTGSPPNVPVAAQAAAQ
jgi:hypothetical protein